MIYMLTNKENPSRKKIMDVLLSLAIPAAIWRAVYTGYWYYTLAKPVTREEVQRLGDLRVIRTISKRFGLLQK